MYSNTTEIISNNSTEMIGISNIKNTISENLHPKNIEKFIESSNDDTSLLVESSNTQILDIPSSKFSNTETGSRDNYLDIFNNSQQGGNIDRNNYKNIFQSVKSNDYQSYNELFQNKNNYESFSLDSKTNSKIDSLNDGISVSISQTGGIFNDLATLGLPLGLAFSAHILNTQKGGFNIYPLGTEASLAAIPLGLIGLSKIYEENE